VGARGQGLGAGVIVEGTHAFAGSVPVVWEMLLDPDVIAKTTPGTREMRRVGPERYAGTMRLGLGPFVAEFDLAIALADVVAPERYSMLITGRGRLATLDGRVALRLSVDGAAAGAVLHYTGDFRVGGAAAALGHRVLEPVGQLLAKQGLEAMSAELTRRLAAQAGPGSAGPAGPAVE
jgi:carbon monoxide dehydrogenase subunit G